MLGERIKKLRKQKKLTLEALAGNQLTKGMLSLIENNKAQPSMESLAYIADQLEVEVADLLEVISSDELRDILEQVEKIYNLDREKTPEKYKQLIELIEPFAENLTQGYQAARILEIYSYALFRDDQENWLEVAERAAKMFDQLNIAANRTNIAINRAFSKFIIHDYDSSLEIFVRERSEIEANYAYIDPMTRLDLDYHEAVLHYAIGDSESATRIMEQAINYAKEKQLFYRVDELYRLAAAQAMMSNNEEKRRYYLEKLKQYGEFADNQGSLLFYKLLQVMLLTSEKHDYQKALEEIDQMFVNQDDLDFFDPWFNLEKGKVLFYLGRYEEALSYLEKVVFPDVHHPFDLSLLYVVDTFKALCHNKLGNKEEAYTSINRAMANFQQLPETPFKTFTEENYQKLFA
ncbi:helix-turn-helix domain-containing protein [Anaerobacillus alkaliphilus]|uniref:Helix-turn-helix domain-containing protein n=1 Tax=Anaerobacillus alkaliphilus TaxID=1548597 RepID=A0A4Q0VLS9_9BACI|nr:helix-turn-helix domain-containing protein [Anaerobacillus alkaliphilus]RXI96163.1 helix-turn-helix domain-containing protein [Anaerobacillus alkaliphilus]